MGRGLAAKEEAGAGASSYTPSLLCLLCTKLTAAAEDCLLRSKSHEFQWDLLSQEYIGLQPKNGLFSFFSGITMDFGCSVIHVGVGVGCICCS